MAPLFSIITVTYNAADALAPTMESVNGQTCKLYEHIIMDGVSTDGTLDLARSLATERTSIHSSPDKGIYDAMNKALSIAKGDYLVFLNAGDAFHSPDVLQKAADAIMENDYPGIVYGDTDIVDASRQKIADRHLKAPDDLTLDSFAEGMTVCHQAFIVLRRIASLYHLKYKYSADYEWCILCLQHSRLNVNLHCVIIDYLSEGATTRNRFKSLRERFGIMCTYYGTLPTIWRHIRFLPRFLKRRRLEKKLQKATRQ